MAPIPAVKYGLIDFRINVINTFFQTLRNRSINELMPMIGARFYTIIDDVLLRGDRIEDELR